MVASLTAWPPAWTVGAYSFRSQISTLAGGNPGLRPPERERKAVGIDEVAAEADDITKTDLVAALIKEHGLGKSRAYELVEAAHKAKRIIRSPLTKKFNRK